MTKNCQTLGCTAKVPYPHEYCPNCRLSQIYDLVVAVAKRTGVR